MCRDIGGLSFGYRNKPLNTRGIETPKSAMHGPSKLCHSELGAGYEP